MLSFHGKFVQTDRRTNRQTDNGKQPIPPNLSIRGHKKMFTAFSLVCFFLPFPKRQILDISKLKECTDDNFKFDKNGRKFSKWEENTVGKGEIAH